MSRDAIRKSIEDLKTEIDALDEHNESARARLGELVSDLESQLDDSAQDDDDGGLGHRFRATVEQFETDHPRTTAILNDIMMTLSNMGI